MQERTGYPKVEVPEKWNGCLLVNPLCPDDLCWLPATPRRQHRWHCLGTDRWCDRFTIGGTAFYMSKTAKDQYDLYHEGAIAQLQMFPEEAEFRRQTNPELYAEAFPDYVNQVQFLRRVRKGIEDENHLRNQHQVTPNPLGTNRSYRSSLLNRTGGNKRKLFPCWCGESLVGRYRQMVVCCVDYLTLMGPWIYLDLDS